MNTFTNLDLFIVGITIAAMGVLGLVVYLNDRQSITNKTFLFLSLAAISYGIFNYVNYKTTASVIVLWLIRLTIFSAVWYAFFLFQFFYVFPRKTITFPRLYKFGLVPLTIFTSILNLTPLVFPRLLAPPVIGVVSKPEPALGVAIFGFTSFGLIIGAIFLLIKKMFHAKINVRSQYRVIFLGTLLTFPLYLIFNFSLPVFFHNVNFIPFAGIFSFPFVFFTFYAIRRHGLLNVRIIGAEILTFILAVATLFEIILSNDLIILLFRVSLFLLVLSIGLLLIKSVLKEVGQREELARLAHSLENANARLKELDQQKTEFLSIASHQLRTPLSVIKGYIELLKDGGYGKVTKDTVKVLDNMDESNERLVRLIDEYLDVSRIEQGRTKYDFAPKDLNAVIDGVTQELKERAGQKGLRLIWSPVKNGPVVIDEEKIRHVVFNFIDNAIKYSEEGQIKVVARQEDDGIAVRVKDNGIGFDKVDEINFFQKFYRGNNVKGVEIGGTGLGIFVCKKFIEAHGGHVWAHSPGLGKGSEFGFWIPVKSSNSVTQ